MTHLLRFLAGLIPAGPWIVINVAEHIGPVVHNELVADDDEADCTCDPDGPQATYVLLPIDSAADLFAEAIRRSDNGALADDVAWDMARELELGDVSSP